MQAVAAAFELCGNSNYYREVTIIGTPQLLNKQTASILTKQFVCSTIGEFLKIDAPIQT
jgi:hypothetical protein